MPIHTTHSNIYIQRGVSTLKFHRGSEELNRYALHPVPGTLAGVDFNIKAYSPSRAVLEISLPGHDTREAEYTCHTPRSPTHLLTQASKRQWIRAELLNWWHCDLF